MPLRVSGRVAVTWTRVITGAGHLIYSIPARRCAPARPRDGARVSTSDLTDLALLASVSRAVNYSIDIPSKKTTSSTRKKVVLDKI